MNSEGQDDVEEGAGANSPKIEKVPSFEIETQNGSTRRVASSKPRREIRKTKRLRKKASEVHPWFLKFGSLFLLVAQLVGLVLLMRYSRTHSAGKDLYLSSTAVFMMEVMKFVTCNIVVFSQHGSTLKGWTDEMKKHIFNAPDQMLKMSVPSFLYVVQNNLLYLALTNLDAATYQVCYQLKILTTAVFSVVMLKRQFSSKKMASTHYPHHGCGYCPSLGKYASGYDTYLNSAESYCWTSRNPLRSVYFRIFRSLL